ncbi:MAG: hypothetical protein ACRECV_11665 [Xanthobacteraceae bacterium]
MTMKRRDLLKGSAGMTASMTALGFATKAEAQPAHPLSIKVKMPLRGVVRERAIVPDLAFGLSLANGWRRYFVVEIDRGTMPVVRSNSTQTSFEQKMRTYLAAYASKQHERCFGWKSFRVLTVTSDDNRMQSMMDALRNLRVSRGQSPSLFLFATRAELASRDPLSNVWSDGNCRHSGLS